MRTLEVIFIVVSFTINPLFDGIIYQHSRNIARIQSPLLGAWRLDSTYPASGPFVTSNGPASEIYIDTVERGFTRSADGVLWRTFLKINPMRIPCTSARLSAAMSPTIGGCPTPPEPPLILTTMPPQGPAPNTKGTSSSKPAPPFVPVVVSFIRIPLPTHYPLYDTKFRFVSYY